MENAAWDIQSARDTGVISSFLQPLDKLVPMVATADVGRVAAELLQETWTGRRVVELEGASQDCSTRRRSDIRKDSWACGSCRSHSARDLEHIVRVTGHAASIATHPNVGWIQRGLD